jgi:hypothetical protein
MGNPGGEHLMKRFGAILTITLLAVIQGVRQCPAQELWTGPKIIYSQAANTDISLPENQDRITDNVWLTRDVSRGLFNIKTEMSFVNFVSPADTEWSLGTTADYDTLPYEDWQSAIGSNPPGSVGEDMVMHLITDDIYLDIKFLTWGERPSAGGFFSYERSTPIPEPTTCTLALAALCLAMTRGRGLAR